MQKKQRVQIEFVAISLARLPANTPIPADLYLKIAGKFLKYLKQNDQLSAEKFHHFLAQGLAEVFVAQEDQDRLEYWLQQQKEQEVEQRSALASGKTALAIEMSDQIEFTLFKTFALPTLTDQQLSILHEQSEEFIRHIKDIKEAEFSVEMLSSLLKYNTHIGTHSVNVANLSVFIGMMLGHIDLPILRNLYLGGLLHDYGKIKIPSHILENRAGALYSHAINQHPLTGAQLLAGEAENRQEKLPRPVLTIIQQHEEMYDGSGYPRGLKEEEIFPLAQIVAFANAFDNAAAQDKLKSFNAPHNRQHFKDIFIRQVFPLLERAALNAFRT